MAAPMATEDINNTPSPKDQVARLLAVDPYLVPYKEVLVRRMTAIQTVRNRLTRGKTRLSDFAAGHEYFGLHLKGDRWVFREWAPNATAVFLVGEMSQWREKETFSLERIDGEGVWEIHLPKDGLRHGLLYRLRIHWPGGSGDRLPVYARRIVQDPETLIFNAQVWAPETPYVWRNPDFKRPTDPPLIYEAHVGMAQEAARIGTYEEFSSAIIPRIVDAGYNTLQLMAIQQHPYYGSFGYHVANFFAASSRFGTPEALKALIDTAHGAGLTVLMDLVHSHAVSNEVEGLSRFDGTSYQFFHQGPRGIHHAWDSRCFDYGKNQVLHFLLSNCRYWLDEYRVDGFRFDGVTSMLYLHHGLERAFTSYDDYFDDSVDEGALTYLALANQVVHEIRPDAMTIAEDISGMPALAVPAALGGIDFDYRFAMGVPDNWIRLIKESPDEAWHMGHLWHELTNRRADEKTISYAESHDQALVGDQTLIFRLIGADMYDHMNRDDGNLRVDRGMALHKLIRLITLAAAGHGYLNFMGNEFGHPEWIDFPRKENNWSYHYARRQWHLVDDPNLKYRFLSLFDRAMIRLTKQYRILSFQGPRLVYEHTEDKVMAFERAGLVFVFNFHPTRSHTEYAVPASPGKYRMIMNSDHPDFGGHGRLLPDQRHESFPDAFHGNGRHRIHLYLPTRTALVLKHDSPRKEKRRSRGSTSAEKQ